MVISRFKSLVHLKNEFYMVCSSWKPSWQAVVGFVGECAQYSLLTNIDSSSAGLGKTFIAVRRAAAAAAAMFYFAKYSLTPYGAAGQTKFLCWWDDNANLGIRNTI